MKNNIQRTSATPKIFGSSYRPPLEQTSKWVTWRPIIIVGVGLILIFLVGRLPIFQIKTVETEGATVELSNEAQKLLGVSIFSAEISSWRKNAYNKYPQINNINCRRGIPNSLHCKITYRTATLIWRSSGVDYLVDSKGYLFTSSEVQKPTLVVEDSLSSQKTGDVVASESLIAQYLRLAELLGQANIKLTSLTIGESLFQVGAIFSYNDKPNLTALFIMTLPLESQVKILQQTLQQKGDKLTSYIDLRVPNYVYFK